MDKIKLNIYVALAIIILMALSIGKLYTELQDKSYEPDPLVEVLQARVDSLRKVADVAILSVDSLVGVADKLESTRKASEARRRKDQAYYNGIIDSLRKLPPDSVYTSTIYVAECDSCMTIGPQIEKENSDLKKEVAATRAAVDSCMFANESLKEAGAGSDSIKALLEDDNKKLWKESRKAKNQTKWTVRGAVVLIVLALLL